MICPQNETAVLKGLTLLGLQSRLGDNLGQTTWNLSGVSPKRDWSLARVNTAVPVLVVRYLGLFLRCFSFCILQSVTTDFVYISTARQDEQAGRTLGVPVMISLGNKNGFYV